jgi:hypothetical protein
MDATIAPLSRAVIKYMAAFQLAAVCRYRDGRLRATRDPEGAEVAWWCEAVKARAVLRLARKGGGDIPAAARAHGVALTDHATVLARATAAVAKIEAGMAWAQRTGVLHEFNQEYRRRRLGAQRRGERFMGYAQATARLRRAITIWRQLGRRRWRSSGRSSEMAPAYPGNSGWIAAFPAIPGSANSGQCRDDAILNFPRHSYPVGSAQEAARQPSALAALRLPTVSSFPRHLGQLNTVLAL